MNRKIDLVDIMEAYSEIDPEGMKTETGDAFLERERYLNYNGVICETGYLNQPVDGQIEGYPILTEHLQKAGLLTESTSEIMFWVTW